jgi:hypothetical protein
VSRFAVIGVLAVGLVAGCGGGSSSHAKLSHADFVKKADAICADYNKQTAKLPRANSYDTIVTYAQQLQKIAKDSVGRFRQLNPPDDERANWKAFARAGDQLIATARQLEQAARRKDSAALGRVLNQARAHSDESHRIGAAMGAPACANT